MIRYDFTVPVSPPRNINLDQDIRLWLVLMPWAKWLDINPAADVHSRAITPGDPTHNEKRK